MTVQRNMDAPLNLPTPANRVETRGVSVMLSSDQNGADPKFVDFAKNANVLNMHLAIAANCSTEPAPCVACPGWPCGTGGRCEAADPGPYRSVRSRRGNRRCEEVLHWLVNGRQRSAMHAGSVDKYHGQHWINAMDGQPFLYVNKEAERGLKPATTCMPARYLELVVAGFSPRSGLPKFIRADVSGEAEPNRRTNHQGR